jgi:hypothetical protein
MILRIYKTKIKKKEHEENMHVKQMMPREETNKSNYYERKVVVRI